MKTILDQDVEELPPYSPVKVTVFVLLLGMIAFAGWRFLRAQAAVAQVAEASKDYRKLFPARAAEVAEPAPAPAPIATAAAPASGMAMLKIDDNMRAQKPTPPPAAPQQAPPSAEPPAPQEREPPVAAAKVPAAAPAKPAQKLFHQPRLNSGAFSGLNGGAGVSISGPGMGGGGANTVPAAAPAMPVIPGLPAVPAPDKK